MKLAVPPIKQRLLRLAFSLCFLITFSSSYTLHANIYSFLGLANESNALELDEPNTLFVNCPHDVYVSCTTYNGNPYSYGQPTVNTHYPNVVIQEHPIEEHTNTCGIGYIIRRWTIHTPIGIYYCTQRITISGSGGGFSYYDIQWPLDYTVNECHYNNLHPDQIPFPYNKPRWNNRPCSMIGIAYEDAVFVFGDYLNPAGCKKILRTWKVIDWCTYNSYTGTGLWTYTQIIKVMDNVAPRFVVCPMDFTVGTFDNNCNGAYVNFPIPVAIDNCTENVGITNNSPYSTLKGKDASGFYPLGTHIVRFLANDFCGNYDTCYVRVVVRDLKQPTPVCHFGLSTTLMMNGMVQLQAKMFDAGSYDNCTSRQNLRFDIFPSTFTCADRGEREVRLVVTDQSGNTDFCITFVRIQDNMNVCPPDTTGGLIGGKIAYVNEANIPGVSVYLRQNDSLPTDITDNNGNYLLDNTVEGKNYQIMPKMKGSIRSGLSTIDIIKLRRHLTGEELLGNPYSIIAADVNRDNQLNVQDLLQLRMMLLLNLEAFPGIEPWRFVDKGYQFQNPQSPLKEAFREIYNIQNHNKTDMTIDFVGVKIGDLDGSAYEAPVDDASAITNRSLTNWKLTLHDTNFEAGAEVKVPVYAAETKTINGIQFTMKFDPSALRFTGLSEDTQLLGGTFGLNRLTEGFVTYTWDELAGTEINKDELLLAFVFEAIENGNTIDEVALNNQIINAEAYDTDLQISPIEVSRLSSKAIPSVNTNVFSLNIAPNPMVNDCRIGFSIDTQKEVNLQVTDNSGKVIFQQKASFEKGMNQFTLNRNAIPAAGLYWLTLSDGNQQMTKSFIVID